MIIKTGTVIHYEGIGPVRFVVRPSSRKVTAKWKDGIVMCNIPPGLTPENIAPVIRDMVPVMNRCRNTFAFDEHEGFEIDGWKVEFIRSATTGNAVSATYSTAGCKISVPLSADFNDSDFTRRVSALLCRVAASIAPRVLIPLACDVAAGVGVSPDLWRISHGHRTLGFCNPRREIALSYMVMFLPRELKEYIICHELAHLTEMNHSDRFHRLCDKYCGGREKELVDKVRRYKWPVLR